ncbi:DUF4082 domain-containing protein [Sphaerisporangium siamense]|uniref:DUF4082 domain-containing protein n=1 Tax=Sphaerisporangium siamense TaxID=795645 RepID=A0A7W7D3W9_9ACTN|nr:DUF4082 domain-containing protein [Sphaerisporangium siamense]MBB4698885.1 hypothetical protein [Sphaerisporangium siamense]
MSLLAAAAVIGATVTVVVINKKDTAEPAGSVVNAAPVSTEVTLETSLWKSRKVVKGAPKAENTPLELGTRFKASRNGEVAGIRFYKPASERGTHRGSLWDSNGKRLAKVTFTDETRSGWQQAMFDKPVPVTAGRTYTVSYHTPDGRYVASAGVFDEPVTEGPLTGQAGVFGIGPGGYPSQVHRKRVSYWVDVVFRHREWRRHRPRPHGSPTASPSSSATAGSPSASPTSSGSAEPTLTTSPTPTSTGGGEPTPTGSSSPSGSPTATATRTRTPSPSPSATRTRTPSPSPSATKTRTPTPTPSPTKPSEEPTSKPPTGDFPGPSTTGVSSGVTLEKSGSVRVTKDGAVVENLEIKGEINIEADNVTVRNVRLAAAPGDWGIIQRQGRSGLTVEDSEIYGNGSQRTQFGILNQGGDLTVRRVDIHTISNGILTEQGLIEDSYLHDPKYFSGDHTDMIMCTSGPPSGEKLVIRNNTVVNTLEQTGAVALFQDFGVVRNVTVEGNFLAGGGYSLYAGAGTKGTSSNIKVIDNVFSKDVWPKGGYNGHAAYWDKNGSGNVWSGNVWEDGKPVNAPS